MKRSIARVESKATLFPRSVTSSLLDCGELPVAEIARLAEREGRRPNPTYQAHKWFARRFSSSFRALLVAARIANRDEFWDAYYEGVDYRGLVVLDPFVGGGTSVVEASLLGADAIGVDIDPVACAITRFELHAANVPDLDSALERLDSELGERLSRYYRTTGPDGTPRDVLHFFWVQEVGCRECGRVVEAHPHFQLAFEAEGKRQWAFCSKCHEIHSLPQPTSRFHCKSCRHPTAIDQGTVNHGVLTCPYCAAEESLIDVSERTNAPPTWRLFALETIPVGARRRRLPMTARSFQRATAEDEDVYRRASSALNRRRLSSGACIGIPEQAIPRVGRADNRLIQYGYSTYRELFNDRQLLHLSLLAERINQAEGECRDALALAFSDHLTTNCMLTYYALGWRRLAPLFSIRAFRHVSRPVEINPWLDGTGRGTFPNAVRQVQRAVDAAKAPQAACREGGFKTLKLGHTTTRRRIIQGDSRKLACVKTQSVDVILTDPPYFDNIAYSELSDFFLPWLESFGLAKRRSDPDRLPPNLAAQARGEAAYLEFRKGLAKCFRQMRRVLKDDGRLVFTYQHRSALAWAGLATALRKGRWRPIEVFPLLGNSSAGPHQHEGTILWDAVTVCRKGTVEQEDIGLSACQIGQAVEHAKRWKRKLARSETIAFRECDHANLLSASLVAAALGMFGRPRRREPEKPLLEALAEVQSSVD
jgi:adenine-specific DNA methylase